MKQKTKKFIVFSFVMLFLILLMACGSTEDSLNEETSHLKDVDVTDFFPFHPDTIFTFEGTGSEYADQIIYFDYIDNNQAQRRIQTAGTTIGQVVHAEDGKIVIRYAKEEFYSFYPLFSEESDQAEVLLMEPLEVGTEWKLKDGRKRSITDTKASISTPYGEFDAIEVTTKSDESVHRSYYAQDIGFVKSTFESSNGSEPIITELASVEENASWEVNLRVYYPDWEEQLSVYKDFSVSISTNESIEELLTKYLQKQPPMDTAAAVLQENVTIQHIDRQPEQQQITIDFNSEITEVGMGSDFESQMLQCIVNTVGRYYQLDRVVIAVEGGPYETGHYYLRPTDYLVPDTENSEEI